MYFHPLDTQLPAPRRMNDPFHYTPDPLCLLAAEIVQRQLPAHPAEGKMVGVLLVASWATSRPSLVRPTGRSLWTSLSLPSSTTSV